VRVFFDLFIFLFRSWTGCVRTSSTVGHRFTI